MHLREQRARRCALALERLDPAQPPEHRACFVHVPNVAGQFARVCVGTVPKGIPFLPSVAASPDRDLGEARAAIDRGDSRAALKSLDHARKGYARALDSEGLEHVLDMAALVDASDDRSRIGRDNLVYAVKQNLRQESRRRARQLGRPWSDPFPDLQAPTEHTGLRVHARRQALDRDRRCRGDCGVRRVRARRRARRYGPAPRRSRCGSRTTPAARSPFAVRRRKLRHGLHETHRRGRPARRRRSTRTYWCRSSGSSGPARTSACRFAFTTPISGSAGAAHSGANLSQATPCPGTTVLPRRAGPADSQL